MIGEDVLQRGNVRRTEGGDEARGTNIDGVDVGLVVRVHVTVGEEPVGEEREQHKLGKREELIARESEAGASVEGWSAAVTWT
jgi:hypothetical protein